MKKILFIFLFIYTVHLSAQELLWEETIGGNDTDWLQHSFENKEGNYIFSGYSHSSISGDKTENSRGESDFWIIETDKEGNLLWQKTIGGSSLDMIFKTIQLEDGTYLMAGYSYSGISGEKTEANRGDRDVWLVKLDRNRNIEWQRTYGGEGVDIPSDIIATNDGGFLLSAESTSAVSGDKTTSAFGLDDLWLLKLNSNGFLEWQKSFGGNNYDFGSRIFQKEDGNFLIAASSSSGISGNKTIPSRGLSDYWLFEISPTGEILWQKVIGGDNGDHLSDLLPTADGGFLLFGDSGSEVSGEKTLPVKSFVDLWLVKVDSEGEILWQKTYAGGDQTEWAANIVPSASGGYIISAMSHSTIGNEKTEENRGGRDFWILKISEDGEVCWDKTLGGADDDQPWSGFEDRDGNYILGGWTDSAASGDKSEDLIGVRDFWVTKISQPEITDPVVNIPEPFKECDRDNNGFAEFELEGLDESIVGEQTNLEVQYFDQDWNPLPSPLPEKFTNTVKDGQVINVRVSDKTVECSQTEFQIFLQVEPCEGSGRDGPEYNIGFPKFFTPNNDGHNDVWTVRPDIAEHLEVIYIFDRYGKFLKQLPPDTGWDGTSGGREMPSDDYWYKARTKENASLTGHFSLVRSSN